MLKINYKKALVACTILTAFCATSAFAAEPAKETKPMKDKAGYCDSVPKYHTEHKHPDEPPRYIGKNCPRPEHRKHVKEAMSKLSPQERKEVERFIEKDRKHRHEMRKAMHKMTPEQREAIRAHKWHHHPKPMPPHNCK